MHSPQPGPGLTVTTRAVDQETSFELVARHLLEAHGPLLSVEALAQVLRYPSKGALERSLQRGHLPLPLVRVPHRRGSFALATEVARFLMSLESSRPTESDFVEVLEGEKGAQGTS
jgi:hypothetical protein